MQHCYQAITQVDCKCKVNHVQYQIDIACGVQEVEDGVQRGIGGIGRTSAHQESESGEQHGSRSAHVHNGVLITTAVDRVIAWSVRGIKMQQYIYGVHTNE